MINEGGGPLRWPRERLGGEKKVMPGPCHAFAPAGERTGRLAITGRNRK